jgi:fatty-acyl-CoA synthase
MHGLMQQHALLIPSLIEHAVASHPDAEIVSRTVEGPLHRCTWRDIHRRCKQLANALAALGVQRGDRVATSPGMATGTWSCISACPAAAPSAHGQSAPVPEQLAYILDHAGDTVLFFDLSFLPLVEQLAPRLTACARLRADDRPRAHARVGHPRPAVLREPAGEPVRHPCLGRTGRG